LRAVDSKLGVYSLEQLTYGNLGPFLVLGIRLGILAQSVLKAQNRNDVAVIMFVNTNPPTSCTVGGVQVSSGRTLGKGTIRISESSNRVAGKFQARDRTCTIGVKTQTLDELLSRLKKATEKEILEMADNILARSDEELFEMD